MSSQQGLTGISPLLLKNSHNPKTKQLWNDEPQTGLLMAHFLKGLQNWSTFQNIALIIGLKMRK